jgi:hypothetical protein
LLWASGRGAWTGGGFVSGMKAQRIATAASATDRYRRGALLVVIVVVGIAGAGLLYSYWDQAVPIAALAMNSVRSWSDL